MKPFTTAVKFLFALGLAVLMLPSSAFAQHYVQKNLVADSGSINQPNVPVIIDPSLVNAWGLTRSATSPWWVADNGAGVSTLYSISGSTPTKVPITVTIPPPPPPGSTSAPTGVVFNGTATDFLLAPATPARFIFATEDGTIAGWNAGSTAVIKVDRGDKAIYKGITIAEWNGKHYLYVTNFHSGKVEVYDSTFTRVHLGEDAFDVDGIDSGDHHDHDGDRDHDHDGDHDRDHDHFQFRGFAPFGIQAVGENIYVTYAKQDAEKHDDVAGAGLGFVAIFSPSGRLRGTLQHGPWMNSPWGIALAPGEFGEFSHEVLIGNFGSGQIAAFNPVTGHFIGLMKAHDGTTLAIDGLWALGFGNGAGAGPYNTLFFTAGPNGESDGLFGTLLPDPATNELGEVDEP